MSKDTGKQFLLKGRDLQNEYDQLIKAKRQALDLACNTSIDYSKVKVQTSSQNATETKFAAYTEYCLLLDEKVEELAAYRTRMLKMIEKLNDSIQRTLLIARYINCETWEIIAEDMMYDIRHIYRIHSAALKNFEEVITNGTTTNEGTCRSS